MTTKLAKQRKIQQITQKLLAQRLGITTSAVCQTEKMGVKTPKLAIRYAKALGCQPIDVIEL